jgi:hypothetical protein
MGIFLYISEYISYTNIYFVTDDCNGTHVAVGVKRQSYQKAAGKFYWPCATHHDHQQIFLFTD